jgi:hypothetical protein
MNVFSKPFLQNPVNEALPPDIHPVVILQGSDYEMGFQYGKFAGQMVERRRDKVLAALQQKMTQEEITRGTKAIQYYIKKYALECIEQIKGIADGATTAGYNISYENVLLLNSTLPNPKKTIFPVDAENENIDSKSCSVFSAWGKATKNRQLIGMDTHDIGDALYQLMIVAYPDEGNNYMCGSTAGEVGNHFLINNKGLFIGNSGGGNSPRSIDTDYGISWSCSLPHIARFANNADEAKDLIMNMKIDGMENFHFVDVDENAYVIEKTSAIQSVRIPGDFGERGFLFSTNNYLNKDMKVTKKGDYGGKHGGYGGATAKPRNQLLWDMLNNYHGEITVDFAKMVTRFPGKGPPYPPEGGWETKILRPSNSRVSVVLPDKGDNGLAYICTGPAGMVIPATIDKRGGYSIDPYINSTKTFFRLRLACDPQNVAEKAKIDAKEDIGNAYSKLMYLDYSYPGYSDLKNLYSLSVKEYYQGSSYLDKAILAKGQESLLFFSEAVTLFTRSQAHAQQVFEALIPPATTPIDLKLKPFGASCDNWETKFSLVQID